MDAWKSEECLITLRVKRKQALMVFDYSNGKLELDKTGQISDLSGQDKYDQNGPDLQSTSTLNMLMST
jgi:hypothetical protein